MPKRPDPVSDLFAIGYYAPIVMAARLQKLALETIRPTAAGRREAARMTSEKSAAAAESMFAAQSAMAAGAVRLWSDIARLTAAFLLGAPVMGLTPALAPVRRRVRNNARRLTGQ